MKWILIASVLSWQPAYNDKETCQLAAEELKKVYYQEVAACIPKPDAAGAAEEKMDRMFDQFLDMVYELQQMQRENEQLELDNSSN